MTSIFAPITALANSSIVTIRISGEEALLCLQKFSVKKTPKANEVIFSKIYDEQKNIIDEVVISYFKAPHSFTGQDVLEISLHSSIYILKQVLQILSKIPNFRAAEAGEFSKIAFLNNKLDLVQAEAVVDLIAAETKAQHRQAIRQLQGELGEIYDSWRFQIIEILALIESAIDFPDEDLPQNIIDQVIKKVANLKNEIASHINDKQRGQKIKDGLSLAIIGLPNVGKSSLLNFLAKSEVAIVSEIAGTTRDVIEIHLDIAGIAVKIADTAGLRQSQDVIEQEGVKRAHKKAAEADIKLLVIDAANAKISAIEQELIDENTIIIVNKIDLTQTNPQLPNFINDKNVVNISVAKKQNTDLLLNKLEEKVLEILPQQSMPLITQERYRLCLSSALDALDDFSLDKNIELAAEDLRIAGQAIGKITGRINVDDILDVVFTKFCIGK